MYDFDGNMTQDATADYTWDAENRLTTVVPRSPSAASKKLVFTYDYMGRRVRKQTYDWNGSTWVLGKDVKFVYDGWNLLLELNGLSSDAVLRRYSWGLDLSGQYGDASPDGIHTAGGIGGLLSMHDAGTSTSHWYFYNANGDIGQLVDSSTGNFSAKYQYYPYGGEIQAVGTYATTNPFRFSTKFWDSEQQAYYYGFRYHKPKSGRWLNRDPIEERGGLHLYQFALNDPCNGIDRLGLSPYTPPSVSPCGAFVVFERNDIRVPDNDHHYREQLTRETNLDVDGMVGFEVVFLPGGLQDSGSGSDANNSTYTPCDCCGTIRLVQVYLWSGSGLSHFFNPWYPGPPKVDNWKPGKPRGKDGTPPPGMTPPGRTGDGRSFIDAPWNSGRSHLFNSSVCAFCTNKDGTETNLGCISFSFNKGDRNGKNRGFQRHPAPIGDGEYKGGYPLNPEYPSDLFQRGIRHWQKN